MNARLALKVTARRAGRYNLWALVAIVAMLGVFAVKAAVDGRHLPSRHFEARPWYETALDRAPGHGVEKP